MTNGEKLREVFPNLKITLLESYVQVMGENYEFSNAYPLKWWNAEYKKPIEHTLSATCKNCKHKKYTDIGERYCDITSRHCDTDYHCEMWSRRGR